MASAASAEDTDELVRQGLALRRAHEDEAALTLFQRAQADSPRPMIRAQVALAEQALGRWVEAESDLLAALAQQDGWIEANRAALQRALSVIQSHLGWLQVSASVESTELWLDGKRLGAMSDAATGLVQRVTSGPHELLLLAADGRRIERSITIEPASRYVYHAEWPSPPAPAATFRGISRPVAPEGAALPNPLSSSAVATKLRPSAPLALPQREATKPNNAKLVAYASAAVALVALGEGITASLLRLKYVHHYNGPSCYPQRSVQCKSDRDTADVLATGALVGYALGGVAAAVSASAFLWPQISASRGSATLLLSGRF